MARLKKTQLKDAFLKAYESGFGNVSAACAAVKISRVAYYAWIKADKAFTNAIEEVDESFIDFAESKLHKKISDGEWVPLKYYLENKAKKRGWANTESAPIMQHTGTIKIEIAKSIIQGNAK